MSLGAQQRKFALLLELWPLHSLPWYQAELHHLKSQPEVHNKVGPEVEQREYRSVCFQTCKGQERSAPRTFSQRAVSFYIEYVTLG